MMMRKTVLSLVAIVVALLVLCVVTVHVAAAANPRSNYDDLQGTIQEIKKQRPYAILCVCTMLCIMYATGLMR
jgi:Na+/melibiose symporter-like transporter